MTVGAGEQGALQPAVLAALVRDVRHGLGSRSKSLPSRWLYEGAGSKLFELITELDEYYLTRAEHAILIERANEIVAMSGASKVIELGSGTSEKTRLLLDAFYEAGQLRAFVALDAAEQSLGGSVGELAVRYPKTAVSGAVTDFHDELTGVPPGPGRLLMFLGGLSATSSPPSARDCSRDSPTSWMRESTSCWGPTS